MIKIHYTTINNELKDKIINRTLSEEELEGIEDMVERDYDNFFKPYRKSKAFGLISLTGFILPIILIFLLISLGESLGIEKGSDLAKIYVIICIVIFVIGIISIFISLFFSRRYTSYIHVNHTLKLLKEHYPESYNKIKQ